MNSINNKVAIVTGGGSGIGQAICQLFAQAGGSVVVTDINLSAATETATSIQSSGGEAIAIEHNVAAESDWRRVIQNTLEQYGQLDILVNNAGIWRSIACESMSLEEWRTINSINLDGVFIGVRDAINVMKDSTTDSSIINIASVNGLGCGGNELGSAYCASKAGVRLLSKSAALECGRQGYNIRINCICPGGVNTPMNETLSAEIQKMKATGHPIGRIGEPIDMARAALFLASEDASFMTGSDMIVDGGGTAGFISGAYPDRSKVYD